VGQGLCLHVWSPLGGESPQVVLEGLTEKKIEVGRGWEKIKLFFLVVVMGKLKNKEKKKKQKRRRKRGKTSPGNKTGKNSFWIKQGTQLYFETPRKKKRGGKEHYLFISCKRYEMGTTSLFERGGTRSEWVRFGPGANRGGGGGLITLAKRRPGSRTLLRKKRNRRRTKKKGRRRKVNNSLAQYEKNPWRQEEGTF